MTDVGLLSVMINRGQKCSIDRDFSHQISKTLLTVRFPD